MAALQLAVLATAGFWIAIGLQLQQHGLLTCALCPQLVDGVASWADPVATI